MPSFFECLDDEKFYIYRLNKTAYDLNHITHDTSFCGLSQGGVIF